MSLFLTAFLMTAAGALWPRPGTLVALAAFPVLMAIAAKRDRHLPISRWHPGSHLAAGDGLDGRA